MRREIEPTLTIWSISSLVAFRGLENNELTELPPGIFDSLTLLRNLYVLSLVAEISFAVLFWSLREKKMSNALSPFLKKNLSLSRCPVFFSPLSLALAWFGLRFELLIRWFRPIIEQLCTQLNSAPGGKKKRNNTEFEASAYWSYMLSPAVISFFLVFEALSKLLNWIWFIFFLLSRYISVGNEMWLLGWHIPTSVYEISRATAPCVYLSRCTGIKGVEIGARFFFGLFSMLRKLQYTRMFVYISGTGLCRPLGDNNLSVLPFSIFQQLTSLTQL